MSNTAKIIIGILLVVLIIMAVMAFKKPKTQIVQVPLEAWPAGCNPNNPGYNMQGVRSEVCAKIYCALNPNDITICNAPSDCYNGCSSIRPGYDCYGNKSENC